jgi:glycosyltransferase involved in cell wall biosynthesis
LRVAIVAPPFISVPPKRYGGTELFVAHLARGLVGNGIKPIVYANGESHISGVEVRWIYKKADWPPKGEFANQLKDINHSSWAVADAMRDCDLVHLNSGPGLTLSRFATVPWVYTVHHAADDSLREFYQCYPYVHYVFISDAQRRLIPVPNSHTIHHGVDLNLYKVGNGKREYLAFLGRIAPVKGTHLAVEVAKRTGIPLKIAGEIQPIFRPYYEEKIKPFTDGKFIEYVGEVDLKQKNDLLGGAMAMLFPIQWQEPFGLVMIESMACGTPVIAVRNGSVPEVVKDGVSGFICNSVTHMVDSIKNLPLDTTVVREYAERYFSVDTMVNKYAVLYRELQRHPIGAAVA